MWGALAKVSVNGKAVREGIGECVDGYISTINPWETDHFVSFLIFLVWSVYIDAYAHPLALRIQRSRDYNNKKVYICARVGLGFKILG